MVRSSRRPKGSRWRGDGTADAFTAVRAGNLTVRYTADPPAIHVDTIKGEAIQRLGLGADEPGVSFLLPKGPVLGLGEGGPQFDTQGSVDRMRSGQGGYPLRTHGGRVPMPWLMGTGGWGMFVHRPFGAFDLTGTEGRLAAAAEALPVDAFIVTAGEPIVIVGEVARITGRAELPPLWSFGYLQSHRTLAGPKEVIGVARTFREKRLPCDGLIYLGTDFWPSGWNTGNGAFGVEDGEFPDPKEASTSCTRWAAPSCSTRWSKAGAERHRRRILHAGQGRAERTQAGRPVAGDRAVVLLAVSQAGDRPRRRRLVAPIKAMGWTAGRGWPGFGCTGRDRGSIGRTRDLRAAPQRLRGYAALRRVPLVGGRLLDVGDAEDARAGGDQHGPLGHPVLGHGYRGVRPPPELTGELYVRWFQFGTFCPLFRCPGRTWKLRLPWGWNTGALGPEEIRGYTSPRRRVPPGRTCQVLRQRRRPTSSSRRPRADQRPSDRGARRAERPPDGGW